MSGHALRTRPALLQNFLCIRAGHPKHPLSGKERFIILTFELLLKLFVAGIFAVAEEEGDDAAIVNMIESILVALLTTVFSALLVFIATCDDRFLGDSAGGMLRCFLSSLSACGLCFAWFFMLVLGSLGVVLVATGENSDFGDYMVVTAQSLGWSWFAVWPLVNGLLLFGFGRWREQRSLAKEGAKTADGIDRETLIWWETNEFPPDVDVIVSDGKVGAETAAPGTAGAPRLEVEAEQAAVAPGNQPVPNALATSPSVAADGAVITTNASFALGNTPPPTPGAGQV